MTELSPDRQEAAEAARAKVRAFIALEAIHLCTGGYTSENEDIEKGEPQ